MKLVYFVSRQKRCLAASLIVFSTQHVTMRLMWVLAQYKQVGTAILCKTERNFDNNCVVPGNYYTVTVNDLIIVTIIKCQLRIFWY